jgi:ABC-type multidrug transport system ATPase subunit
MGPRETGSRSPHPDKVGLPVDRRSEPMENLSRGMQQKVALARALLTSPVLLLLDEPTTGLDPRSKLEVQEFVRDLRRTHDSTILLCTHDLAEAEALADRVGILDRGELLFLETVPEILERFESRRWRRRSSLRRDASSRRKWTRTTKTGSVRMTRGAAATLRAS